MQSPIFFFTEKYRTEIFIMHVCPFSVIIADRKITNRI